MRQIAAVLVVLALLPLLGCDSSDDGPQCSFNNPASLAQSSWPKFRQNLQNTGAISGVTLAASPSIRRIFTAPSAQALVSSPVLGNGGGSTVTTDQRVYVGSLDGNIYALDSNTLAQLPNTDFSFGALGPISSTALVGTRFGSDALFVGSTDSNLYALNQLGGAQPDFWPTSLSGTVSASPTLSPVDGTVFAGSFSRLFFAVCPNGVQRFGFSTTGPMDSSPAVTAENLIVFGGEDRQLRGMGTNGFFIFSVTTAGAMANAPVVELNAAQQTVAIYAADSAGGLLKVTPTGQTVYSTLLPAGVSQSSPALANDPNPASGDQLPANHLYVGDDSGQLHAINTADGSIAWSVPTAGPIRSSPAVAINGNSRTVVVASADGTLYFIEDAGDAAGAIVSVALGAPTQSSPAIRKNSDGSGTVYIGDDSGRLLMIQ